MIGYFKMLLYSDFQHDVCIQVDCPCFVLSDSFARLLQSKQKSRSYSFDSMNRDKRHFVHEYCEHFGCESVAYDQEPKRNVVATAARDKVITRETVRIFIILKDKMNWMIISEYFFVLGLVTKHESVRGDTKGKWTKENS